MKHRLASFLVRFFLLIGGALMPLAPSLTPVAAAANCAGTQTSSVPIPDLGTGTYLNLQGGLYPSGSNTPPAAYASAGTQGAAAIVPRNTAGQPDPNGSIVLASIGLSNTNMEFGAFQTLGRQDPLKDPHVRFLNGAIGGADATAWLDPNAPTWSQVMSMLTGTGGGAGQVQAIWLKTAIASPSGDTVTYIQTLASDMRRIVVNAKQLFPNLQQVFVSPRTYAGYATVQLSPEPYAYATGFADKGLVLSSVNQPTMSPWVSWGPYIWTNGLVGSSSGLVWTCDDVRSTDGTHPSDSGQQKIATMLQQFFDTSTFTPWYRRAR